MHGQVTIGGVELSDINKESLMENITYIGHQSYLFKGTVRDNLIMGCSGADDAKLWEVLERVNLSSFLKNENGLDTMLTESQPWELQTKYMKYNIVATDEK